MAEKFWMVFGGYCAVPTYKHLTKQAAITEAKRLSDLKGQTFTVLEAVTQVRPVERHVVEEILGPGELPY